MIQLFDPNHEIKRSLRPSGKARLAHCFNSRLREEATSIKNALDSGDAVSTHASVRRRLERPADAVELAEVSTHASVRRRRGAEPLQPLAGGVSTHASVRRRQARRERHLSAVLFQLTPP